LIVLGGEVVQVSDIICWQDVPDGCELMNLYGCSEASIISIYKIPKQWRRDMVAIPIGALLPGMHLHIRKPDGSDACINERGEIVIMSEHIADSYWNHPAETKRVFRQCGEGRRCYYTGDMAYIGFDGELYFAGRADRQVQIRGHRVELPEIEVVIQSIPGLVQAVVAYNRQGDRQPSLVAFYQCDTDFYLDEAMLRDILKLRLPPYMMPDDMVQLDQFPVTVSGKVDYEALKNQDQPVKCQSSSAMPETEMEQSIYHLFQQVVAAENLGIDDDFFMIGGNSLSALKLEAEFEIQKIPLDYKAIYLYKTVRALAIAAMQKEKDCECDITKHRAV
jgi:acyl-coenzyme A synthetase/AMP-(fatty) acid ligase